MKCLSCRAEIDDNSKFCGYCGAKVEEQDLQELSEEKINNNEISDVSKSVEDIEHSLNEFEYPTKQESTSDLETNDASNSVQDQPSKDNKKSNGALFVIIGVLLFALATVLAVVALNKDSRKPVEVIEDALESLVQKSKNSATVDATISVKGSEMGSIKFSGSIKYQKINNTYAIEAMVNPSLLFKKMSAFMQVENNKLTAYVNSNIVDMISGTSSDEEQWLYYNLSDFDLSELETSNKKLDLSNIGLDRKLKLVDTNNGLKHYQLTIDNDLIKNIYNKVNKEQFEELGESIDLEDLDIESFIVDLYVNKSNVLETISMDLSQFTTDLGLEEASVEIKFKDLGNTKVTIPSEALNSTKELDEYILENSEFDDYEYDDYKFDDEE